MATHAKASSVAVKTHHRDGGALVMEWSGSLQASSIHSHWSEAKLLIGRATAGKTVVFEASQVTYCDLAGVGMMIDLETQAQAVGATFRIEGLDPRFQKLLDQFSDRSFTEEKSSQAQCQHITELIGRGVAGLVEDVAALIRFVGELVAASFWAIFHPGRIRWRDAMMTCENVGANALPIVALISFLIGLIIAFQAAIPLGQFGAQNFVADLVGVSLVRELGPLMTAIILAGRSGAAFAAEIGTMTVNEEVNALNTMGLQPVRFLVVTRVAAAVVMMPFLTAFSLVFGLLGGLVVYLSLGFSVVLYYHQLIGALELADLLGGLFKAGVFGLLVAAVGCFRGLQTEMGASAVGLSTTRAVVSGITLIVMADGVFSVAFYVLGI